MYSVYILILANKQHYVGFTEDIVSRIKDHQKGKCDTIVKYRPVKLDWYCSFKNKGLALAFEKYLKSGSGIEFRRRHFQLSKK